AVVEVAQCHAVSAVYRAAGAVDADIVALDYIAADWASAEEVGDLDAGANNGLGCLRLTCIGAVAGDDVSQSGIGAADRVVLRAAFEMNSVAGVCQLPHSGHVDADDVALDQVLGHGGRAAG